MSSTTRTRPRARVWQTTTFRLAVVFAAAFGIGTAILLLVLDLAVARFAEETARDALRDQVAVLKADANAEGGSALIDALREHVSGGQPERFSYLVVAPNGHRLEAGLPRTVETTTGWGKLALPTVTETPGADPYRIEVFYLTDRADDGTFIAVGRDTYALEELREWLHRLAVWGGATLVLLAIAGGAGAGVLFLNRLKRVSAAAERVVNGHMGERLPSLGFGREFDDLADTLNGMLDRLEDTVEALRQVSSDVAHDLRTPLTRLRNTLEDAHQQPDRKELLAEALSETDRLLEIFAALLRLAQIEGGADRRFAPVDLALLADDVVEAYRPSAEEAGRRLILQASGAVPVRGDGTMLAQLMASLIDNAITHGAGGTEIRVLVSAEPKPRLIVEDDGPGAPEVELARLTRRFYRLDRSRNTPGTGLGLSMVAAMARLHGAELSIENRHPGLRITLGFPAP